MKTGTNLEKFINEAMAIEQESALEAGELGYMAKILVQATMPHSNPKTNEFERSNGYFTLSMVSPSKIGLPYGNIPRLLMAWITTEAVKKKDRTLILGKSLSQFMSQLNLLPTGGRWGSITRLKTQMQKLFSTSIKCFYDNPEELWAVKDLNIIEEARLWWEPKEPEQTALWESSLILSKKFFEELIEHPIPLDMRAIKALKQSSLALDIYCWLTHRLSYLNNKTEIPWVYLHNQFGAEYNRTRDFKRKFLEQLKAVTTVYSEANIANGDHGLILKPSKPHVLPKSE